MEWEVRIIEWIQDNFAGVSNVLGNVFSFVGGEIGLMILIVVVLFCYKKQTGQKLALIIASLHGWFSMIKTVVLRPRPYVQYPDRVKPLAPADPDASPMDIVAQGYSFPSMHSGSTAASYFTLARDVDRKWFWILAAALTLLVGFFRIATGNHYPTDVLAGWTMGFAVIGIFDLLEKYVKKSWVRSLILLLLTVPGVFFVRTNEYYTSLGLLIGAICGIPFERRYVNYQETKKIPVMILRVLGGFAVYFGFNTLLKLPFSKEFLESEELAAFLVRTCRYAIIMFVIIGVYPMIFPFFEKIGKEKKR